MKGIVFTEFLDMVDQSFGPETTDRILDACHLDSGGAYTAVDIYDGSELHLLVGALSDRTKLSVEQLQRAYGRKLFSRFEEVHPEIFRRYRSAFEMLSRVGGEIHRDVRKLDPNAALPHLSAERPSDKALILTYRSRQNMPSFCRGLIEGCLLHFGTPASIRQLDLGTVGGLPSHQFIIEQD
ncbi:heme NO-binding domain-containing protein [Parvularcula lutaonensis]|uniref:Heme NO-binding domain-containing protein n=1 Tax=Parvularcula lutaonensis TaxID=491923 RepID=A0ABV7MG02_9PROT|nr:heme NO-binding domain-containing protein [Parvularcula lutaonensis]GGY51148.1 guanylate cyclase [Parvularcula lutaonensis]